MYSPSCTSSKPCKLCYSIVISVTSSAVLICTIPISFYLTVTSLTDYPWLALGGVGPRGQRIFFLTSTRWLPMYENQNPATISRQKCYQMYLWPFQTSKINFLLNDPFFYWSVPKVAYWWVEQHIKRSVSVPQPLQSYRMMKFHLLSKLFSYMRILLRNKNFSI